MNFLWFAIVGIVAGWFAGQIMKGAGFGLVGNLVVGVVGAFVGGLLFNALGLSTYGTGGALITATAGAIVLLAIVGALKRA